MRYALLIHADEAAVAAWMDAAVVAEFVALGRELERRGAAEMVGRLAGPETATTVRVRDGRVLVTDGPFAEAKELLGGFSIARFDSRAAAVAHAARIPTARIGGVEVRPLAALPAPPVDPVPPVDPGRA